MASLQWHSRKRCNVWLLPSAAHTHRPHQHTTREAAAHLAPAIRAPMSSAISERPCGVAVTQGRTATEQGSNSRLGAATADFGLYFGPSPLHAARAL